LFFCANVLIEPKGSFKFQGSGLLVDPFKNMIYNHIFNGVLPMKTPQEVWKGAQDHNHGFMQVLLKTCSLPSSQILDITIGTCLF